MNMITFMLTLSFALTIILTTLTSDLLKPTQTQKSSRHMNAASTPLDPLDSHSQSAFSSVAILFLLFDLEIALLLPLPWAIQLQSPTTTLTWTSIIIILLTLGLIYEWTQGGLEWAE
uniref:NADH-ubiquinone oxidoreductase chain 3 n=1 Tax=Threskiornis aethiopicus TaxID=100858 RepID=A0A7R6ZX99_9AVES|nr:NADH dehydrogenase subunit 3 [Threskiornis aethiopicus]